MVVDVAPPQFVLKLTGEAEDVVDRRHQNVRLVDARQEKRWSVFGEKLNMEVTGLE